MQSYRNQGRTGEATERKCSCGTRSSCPVHGRDRVPDYEREQEYLREAAYARTHQPCGGGFRVVRKRIGGE